MALAKADTASFMQMCLHRLQQYLVTLYTALLNAMQKVDIRLVSVS